MRRSDSPPPEDKLEELKTLAAKITVFDETKSLDLDSAVQRAAVVRQNTQYFFKLMDAFKVLPALQRAHPEVIAIFYDLLVGEALFFADDKEVAVSSEGLPLLHELFKGNFPSSCIQAVLDRPEAKFMVRYRDMRADLLSYIMDYRLDDSWTINAFATCLSLMEQPWLEFGSYICNDGSVNDSFERRSSILLKALMEKLGAFPWDDFSVSYFSINLQRKEKICKPEIGHYILTLMISYQSISLDVIEKFIESRSIDFWDKLRKQKMESLKFGEKLNPSYTLQFIIQSFDQEEDEKILFERINYVLKKGLDVVTEELLQSVAYIRPKLYKHLLSSCAETLYRDPPRGSAIIQYVMSDLADSKSFDEIKTCLFPKNLKNAAALVNFRHRDFNLLEKYFYQHVEIWRRPEESVLRLFLDCGGQVTGKAISILFERCLEDDLRKNLLEMMLAPEKGVIWCQEAQQGYELLSELIEWRRPIKEMELLLKIKEAHIVRDYVGKEGESFSNLMDIACDPIKHDYGKGYAIELIIMLVRHGAQITAHALDYLLLIKKEKLALIFLKLCQPEALCKNPRGGSALISKVIEKFNPSQVQPLVDCKTQAEAIADMLSVDMSAHAPLAQACEKFVFEPIQETRQLLELLIEKGAMISAAVLKILKKPIHSEMIELMMSHFNAPRLHRMPSTDIHELLAELIHLKRPLSEVKQVMNGSDEKLMREVMVQKERSLLTKVWQWLRTDQDYALQLVDLLMEKGHGFTEDSLKNLEAFKPELQQVVFQRLSKYSLAIIHDEKIYKGDILDIIHPLIRMQAPLEWIKTTLDAEKTIRYNRIVILIVEICVKLLTAENSCYISQIIALCATKIKSGSLYIPDSLFKKYAEATDSTVKNNIAAIIAALSSPVELCLVTKLDDLPKVLSEKCLLTTDYFQAMQSIITALLLGQAYPKPLVAIIFNYVNHYSALEDLSRKMLTQAYTEFTFLHQDRIILGTEILSQMQALLACWQALAADKSQQYLVNGKHLKKIESIVESTAEMKPKQTATLRQSIKEINQFMLLSGGTKLAATLPVETRSPGPHPGN